LDFKNVLYQAIILKAKALLHRGGLVALAKQFELNYNQIEIQNESK
jgi:hypothetical protein